MDVKTISYNTQSNKQTLAQEILLATQQYHVVHIVDVPFAGDALEAFYDELTNNIGECLDLGEAAASKTVGGKWTHVCYDPTIENAYRSTSNPQPLHTDGAYQSESPDATCMYCISTAPEGGETVFISGQELVNALKTDNPQLLDELCTLPVCFSRAFNNGDNQKTRRIIEQEENGIITLTWNYYRVDPNSSDEVKELCSKFHNYLETKIMGTNKLGGICLKPGEGVLWLDERVLHGRNGFIAHQYGDRNLAKTSLNLTRIS